MAFVKLTNFRKLIPIRRLMSSDDQPSPDKCNLFAQNKQKLMPEIEQRLNEHIGRELFASHTSLAMAQHYYNTEQCLTGFGNFFRQLSNTQRQHAFVLSDFQNQRGGTVRLGQVDAPASCGYQKVCEPFLRMLEIEDVVSTTLCKLVDLSFKEKDFATSCFLADTFVPRQVGPTWNWC
jgi:ferritin